LLPQSLPSELNFIFPHRAKDALFQSSVTDAGIEVATLASMDTSALKLETVHLQDAGVCVHGVKTQKKKIILTAVQTSSLRSQC
jgi:hypothetical protein